MKENDIYDIESLLPSYFSGDIEEENRKQVDAWVEKSAENQKLFNDSLAIWESGLILNQMEQFSTSEAWRKIDKRLSIYNRIQELWIGFQKVAAILLLPALVYGAYLTLDKRSANDDLVADVVWQKASTSAGMISELTLPDGTHVWLNSGSSLEYPMQFSDIREVKLSGEAYFDVKKDKEHPFTVNTGNLNVEVLGTIFNVSCYPESNQTNITLVSGRVKLFTGDYENKKDISVLSPNENAQFDLTTKQLYISSENVNKYTVWKDGVLIFDDDPMDIVAEKLGRWFNVDVVLESRELSDYVYRGTFTNESLIQILDLLELSAPIRYSIKDRVLLPNGQYSKGKILIQKR